jgi:hypothetical protein
MTMTTAIANAQTLMILIPALFFVGVAIAATIAFKLDLF